MMPLTSEEQVRLRMAQNDLNAAHTAVASIQREISKLNKRLDDAESDARIAEDALKVVRDELGLDKA